ncbi:hypothetical protein D3C74_298040 [compost metagenome]
MLSSSDMDIRVPSMCVQISLYRIDLLLARNIVRCRRRCCFRPPILITLHKGSGNLLACGHIQLSLIFWRHHTFHSLRCQSAIGFIVPVTFLNIGYESSFGILDNVGSRMRSGRHVIRNPRINLLLSTFRRFPLRRGLLRDILARISPRVSAFHLLTIFPL